MLENNKKLNWIKQEYSKNNIKSINAMNMVLSTKLSAVTVKMFLIKLIY